MGLPFAAAFAQIGEYNGPAVLSRGVGGGVAPRAPIILRPYVGLSATYTTGLSDGSTDAEGKLLDASSDGFEVNAGLYGYHAWRHTVLALNYYGDYRKYRNLDRYDGTNHFLAFGVTHELNSRVTVSLRQGAGTFRQNYGLLSSFGFFDPGFAQIPQDEILDTRTSYLTSMVDMTVALSRRLSVNIGGSGFMVHRRYSSLYGVDGASGRIDCAYRLTRRSTLGVDYFFTEFTYSKNFGDGNLHSVGLDYSFQPSRTWEFRLRLGGVRAESKGAAIVELDPAIAAILGRSTGTRVYYVRRYIPTYGASAIHRFRAGTLTLEASRGAMPGNGIYMTSSQNAVGGSLAFSALRTWDASVGAGYSDLHSVGQNIRAYHNLYFSAHARRPLLPRRHSLYAGVQMYLRRFVTGDNPARVYLTTSVGISYNPGDFPLRF